PGSRQSGSLTRVVPCPAGDRALGEEHAKDHTSQTQARSTGALRPGRLEFIGSGGPPVLPCRRAIAMSATKTGTAPSSLVAERTAIVGAETVIPPRDELVVYECGGYVIERNVPDVVVFPTSTEHVVRIVKLCKAHDVPFVPRGAGTSLAGGTLAVGGGVM